jgi:hypothetical protein
LNRIVSYPFLAFVAVAIFSTRIANAETEPSAESTPFVVNTSTVRLDSDSDGMPDDYELALGLNPLINDANSDADNDGLTNIQEFNAGTNPLVPDSSQLSQSVSATFSVSTSVSTLDTDGDGMRDDWEIAHGLDPLRNDSTEDTDGDSFTNIQEYNAGTNPISNDSAVASVGFSALFAANIATFPFPVSLDTDGDGMPDWWEQRYGLNPTGNDANGDLDGDGIPNATEFLQGGNPSANESVTEFVTVSASFILNTVERPLDTDGDGIPDSWELGHGLNPLVNDGGDDPDSDGRSNLDEYNAGTNPLEDDWRGPSSVVSALFITDTGGFNGSRTRDTDGDGIPDWWELLYGLNWELNDSILDTDGDGISNLDEFNSGSNPIIKDRPTVIGVSGVFLVDTGGRSADSDGDGIPDWWEKLYFNDSRIADPLADSDGDGQSNLAEFRSGSSPLDANSVLRIVGLQATRQTNGATIMIRWASFEGRTYSIWSALVVDGPYTAVATNLQATPPWNTFGTNLNGVKRFFRIQAAPYELSL